jgi:hypothetical protein
LQLHIAEPHRGVGSSLAAVPARLAGATADGRKAVGASSHVVGCPMLASRRCHVGDKTPKRPPKPKKPKPPKPVS